MSFIYLFSAELNGVKPNPPRSQTASRRSRWQAQTGAQAELYRAFASTLKPSARFKSPWIIKHELWRTLPFVCAPFFSVLPVVGTKMAPFPFAWMKELMTEAVISGLQPSSDLRSVLSDGVCCEMKRAAVTPPDSRLRRLQTFSRPAVQIKNNNNSNNNMLYSILMCGYLVSHMRAHAKLCTKFKHLLKGFY